MTALKPWDKPDGCVRLFLAGDVMTGRGVDQLFAVHNPDVDDKPGYTSGSWFHEASARIFGGVSRPVDHGYIWGAIPGWLDAARPDFRVVNLETPITTRAHWADKRCVFRMHPANTPCLAPLGIDCLALANNHMLDFGVGGLEDTLRTLDAAGIGHAGAGPDLNSAEQPHAHPLPGGGRILVFSWGFGDSGCRQEGWAAGCATPGINYLPDMTEPSARSMVAAIWAHRRSDDIVIASLHWGGNWVGEIPGRHRALARFLIDVAGVDVIHGHSSHHVLPVEVYRGRPILYGCGDLINDYEGIKSFRARRGHLGALYFIDLQREKRRLEAFRAIPLERRRFRPEVPSETDGQWVREQIGPRSPEPGA